MGREAFEMTFRMVVGLFAGVCALVILVTPPLARTYAQGRGTPVAQRIDEPARTSPTSTPAPMPVSEPAALILVSLGLLAVGVAVRLRRAVPMVTFVLPPTRLDRQWSATSLPESECSP